MKQKDQGGPGQGDGVGERLEWGQSRPSGQ